MNRRTALASAGTTLAALLAGCSAPTTRPDPSADPPEKTPPSDPATPTFDPPEFTETRVDEPPYEITRPEVDPDSDPGKIDDMWNAGYLGANMNGDSDLSFEVLDDARLANPRLWPPVESEGEHIDPAFTTEIIASQDEEGEVFETFSADIDYSESIVVVVESGYGSGSIRHRWKRIEASSDGVHLHGYYRIPWVQTSDYTSRTSVVRVNIPHGQYSAEPDARVSLTTAEDTRVHFSSIEGVVGLPSNE